VADVDRPLADVLAERGGRIPPEARVFLRCGRQLVELTLRTGRPGTPARSALGAHSTYSTYSTCCSSA